MSHNDVHYFFLVRYVKPRQLILSRKGLERKDKNDTPVDCALALDPNKNSPKEVRVVRHLRRQRDKVQEWDEDESQGVRDASFRLDLQGDSRGPKRDEKINH